MLRSPSPARVVAASALAAALLATPGPAGAAPGWVRPVPGAVARSFVAPVSAYGPGHRGIDLRADPGEPVVAVAAGVVERAGAAGGSLHVVLRLAERLRAAHAENPDVSLVVSADGQARHQAVVRVIDLAKAEGITHYAIGVERPD